MLQWPPNRSPITFVALSAITINRNGRRDVSLEQHTMKPQPRLQISPPVAPRASETNFTGGVHIAAFRVAPTFSAGKAARREPLLWQSDSGTSTFVNPLAPEFSFKF
jgi:hypothetical protein